VSDSRPRQLSADRLGKQWAQGLRSELQIEGRRIVGGWPGTLSEARHRVSVHCTGSDPKVANAYSAEERESLARSVYARARSEWLSLAARGGGAGDADL